VLVGPHVQAYAEELIQQEFVDHCVVGEYEVPALDIALRCENGKPIYRFEHLDDINEVNGQNFVPFMRLDVLHNYRDPSMNTPRPQLTVSTSRGCPFKWTYCQWPKVMNNGQYRNRQPEFVLEEIRRVIELYKSQAITLANLIRNARVNFENF